MDEAKARQMIVESGALASIATSKFIEKCLKDMEVKKNEITERECYIKFKIVFAVRSLL